jgi:purine-binding chemotaxis protein CheW
MEQQKNITANPGPEPAARPQRGGKYLTFGLADEIYGIQIMKVREIIGLIRITRVPGTPDYIRGVINLRGKVIPVLDLKARFLRAAAGDSGQACIVVVEIPLEGRPLTVGFLVESVWEVLDIGERDIENTPSFGAGVNTGFMLGLGKARGRVILLLDADRILSTEELLKIEKVSEG